MKTLALFIFVLLATVTSLARADDGNGDIGSHTGRGKDCTLDTEVINGDEVRITFQDANGNGGTYVPLRLLPLKEGLNVAIPNRVWKDDVTVYTYKNGILKINSKLESNYTRDVTELVVSPDLKKFKSLHYQRTSLIFGILGGAEKILCDFK